MKAQRGILQVTCNISLQTTPSGRGPRPTDLLQYFSLLIVGTPSLVISVVFHQKILQRTSFWTTLSVSGWKRHLGRPQKTCLQLAEADQGVDADVRWSRAQERQMWRSLRPSLIEPSSESVSCSFFDTSLVNIKMNTAPVDNTGPTCRHCLRTLCLSENKCAKWFGKTTASVCADDVV